MTRIEAARRNVRIARTAIAVSAVGGLAAFAGLAKMSHPGKQGQGSAASQAAVQQDSTSSGFFSTGSGDGSTLLGPSGGAAPQVQSGGS
jgi:hypothetical protein